MASSPLPSITTVRPSSGVLVFVGLAGILSAVGAAAGGFLARLSTSGVVEYSWGNTLRYAAIFALVGGMLSLSQHEVGVPIVIGSSASIVAVVGTVIAGQDMKLSTLLDPYPVRGVLFIGAGIIGVFGIAVGLAGLRGRSNAGFGVPIALLSLISLGMTAAIFHLDETRHAEQVRPFVGFVFIAVVCVVCSFLGRFGAFAAAVASASIISLFIDSLDVSDFRQPAVIADVVSLALIITLGSAAVAAASRRDAEVVHAATSRNGAGITRDVAVQPQPPLPNGAAAPTAAIASAITGATLIASPARAAHGGLPTMTGVGSLPTRDFAATADQLLSGHPLIAPYEPTSAIAQQTPSEADRIEASRIEASRIEASAVTGAVSTIGQWAPDPYGRHELRYWDGAHWTADVRTNGISSTDPV